MNEVNVSFCACFVYFACHSLGETNSFKKEIKLNIKIKTVIGVINIATQPNTPIKYSILPISLPNRKQGLAPASLTVQLKTELIIPDKIVGSQGKTIKKSE